jgi:hypothetical protein
MKSRAILKAEGSHDCAIGGTTSFRATPRDYKDDTSERERANLRDFDSCICITAVSTRRAYEILRCYR